MRKLFGIAGSAHRQSRQPHACPAAQAPARRASDWYRHATQHNSARVGAGGIEADVTLRPAGDPGLNAQVSAAYQAKYGDQASWLAMFLRAPATETTLRLDRPDA